MMLSPDVATQLPTRFGVGFSPMTGNERIINKDKSKKILKLASHQISFSSFEYNNFCKWCKVMAIDDHLYSILSSFLSLEGGESASIAAIIKSGSIIKLRLSM